MYHVAVAFVAIIGGVAMIMGTLALGAHLNRQRNWSFGYMLHNWAVSWVLLLEFVLGALLIYAIW